MPAPRVSTCLGLLLIASGCFPKQAGPRLQHFYEKAPGIGEAAPPFTLVDTEGRNHGLEHLLQQGPVVLQLGSHSCPVYRYRRHRMEGLVAHYKGRVAFVVVYTREAHPSGSPSPYTEEEWNPWINRIAGIRIRDPATLGQRCEVAAWSRERLGLDQVMLVDAMDDLVWRSYGAASSPAFVIARDGTVAARQVWLDPDTLRPVLDRLLAEEGKAASRP